MATSDEEQEQSISFAHYGGRASGFEDAESFLRKAAMGEFDQGHDEIARVLRAAAKDLATQAKECRRVQKEYERVRANPGGLPG